MSTDPRKRQKKQERLAAKRKSKRQLLFKEKHAGIAERLTAATRHPVLHCWVTTDFWTQGIGWVCLSRELPNGSVAVGIFLVDRYCLGVKNALAKIASRFDYESRINKVRSDKDKEDLQPAAARKLVESAVAYAQALGLQPHEDYHKAKRIFGEIDATECTEQFPFGKDGKPYFISGPNDTPERCRRVLRTLEQSCGRDGFHYLIPLGGNEEVLEVLPESFRGRLFGMDENGLMGEHELDFSEDQGP